MVKGYIFDYGGTLDTAGTHWGQVLWQAYKRNGIPVSENEFREAYVHAERLLGRNHIIQQDYTFHKTLDIKLRIELEHLTSSGYWKADENEIKSAREKILNGVYEGVKKETGNSRKVLETLSAGYPLVLVSNFYGNINIVLEEFGLHKLFSAVMESAVVGVRKPDPEIFTLGVKALNMKPEETVVVGDSFTKDIIPASKAGCNTIWLKGKGWTETDFDETIPGRIITNLEELL